jgi:hypothetical protein
MGDCFVMLVDVDAKIDEADELAERVLSDNDRLVDKLFEASGQWVARSGLMLVSCPECGEEVLMT